MDGRHGIRASAATVHFWVFANFNGVRPSATYAVISHVYIASHCLHGYHSLYMICIMRTEMNIESWFHEQPEELLASSRRWLDDAYLPLQQLCNGVSSWRLVQYGSGSSCRSTAPRVFPTVKS